MKRLLSTVLALVMVAALIPALPAWAAEAPAEFLYGVYDDHVEITGYYGGDPEVDIPSEIEGKPVTSIAEDAFSFLYSITRVTIPGSVKYIGMCAFQGCDNLSDVTMGEGVETIHANAFRGCDALKSITIPASVTYIDVAVFAECTRLSDIYVDENNTKYTDVDGVLFDKAVTELVAYPCGNTRTSYIVPNGVKNITEFSGCPYIEKVIIQDGATFIGPDAFWNCVKLNEISLPDTITAICAYAFENTAYFNNGDNWEDGMLYIGKHLIRAKEDVKGYRVIKPETLTIALNAFQDCRYLTGVTIPGSLMQSTYYYEDLFFGCQSLQEINVDESNGFVSSIDGVLLDKTGTTLICYPAGKKLESYTIPDKVTDIGSRAFYGCEGLKNIMIHENVISIGMYAFEDTAYYNDSDNWEDGVLYIGDCLIVADDDISGDYSIRSGTRLIAELAFDNCENLTGITIPDSVLYIGQTTFDGCRSLTSVSLPGRLTRIESLMFQFCDSLESVSIPESVTYISWAAFSGCYNLSNVYYAGSPSQWAKIDIKSGNEPILNANITFGKEDEQPGEKDLYDYEIGFKDMSYKDGILVAKCTVAKNDERRNSDKIVLAIYEDGMLIDSDTFDAQFADSEEFTLQYSVNEGCVIKAFVWDGYGALTPLSETAEYEVK